MTTGELKERTYKRLDEDAGDPAYFTPTEVLNAINAGLRALALLTLCIERTANFTISAATCWHTILDQFSDCIRIFRVRKGATRIQPTTFHEQDCYSAAWEATAGAIAGYLTIGCNLLAVTPQPAGGDTLSITYAACPAALVSDSDVPEVPEEYHQDLVDFAIFYLRLKEGGLELKNAWANLLSFYDAASKLAIYVRARCQAQDYDIVPPFDIAARDRSRKVKVELKTVAGGKKAA